MTNDGAPACYAVIGNPVAHSLSPRIHAHFAEATGEHLRYEKLAAPKDGFAAAADRFFASGGAGLNVTLPFKQDAWRWVDSHDGAASEARAVNTIVPEHADERGAQPARPSMRGCNTDGVGLVRDLANRGWRLADARVLVLGAGGAVQGVLGPLKRCGAALTVANRTRAKAEELARRFDVAACGLAKAGDGWDIVVNGTSAGVEGQAALVAPEAVAGSRCYDMFYALDAPTPFCRWAAEHDAEETSDGLGMLVEQAAEAFFLWRGVRPSTAFVLDELRGGQ